VDAKNIFALEEITWLVDTLISMIVGLLCGGGGIAVIANGLPGIVAGVVISLLVLALGKDRMQNAFLNANIPHMARKIFPMAYFEARVDKISEEVKQKLYESLETERNDEITDRLVNEISEQIETCLTRMAEIVEIPLG